MKPQIIQGKAQTFLNEYHYMTLIMTTDYLYDSIAYTSNLSNPHEAVWMDLVKNMAV